MVWSIAVYARLLRAAQSVCAANFGTHRHGCHWLKRGLAGQVGVAGASVYAASKSAVEGLTKSAALEGAAFGVRINAVAPGPVATDMLDRTDEQIIEIRHGHASFDTKLDALARLTKGITQSRGHVDQAVIEAFFAAGWTKENLVDAIVIIGDKTVSNYLHSTTKIPVDFPAAPKLD